MLEPNYPGADAWVSAVEWYCRDAALSPELAASIVALARAEVCRATEDGTTSATASDIAAASNLPVREVKLIRARLIDAGMISITGRMRSSSTDLRRLHLSV